MFLQWQIYEKEYTMTHEAPVKSVMKCGISNAFDRVEEV